MPAAHKGAISFGLVHIPIALHTATQDNDIRPIYYDKTYHALPESGGDKAFELLRRAMMDEAKVNGKGITQAPQDVPPPMYAAMYADVCGCMRVSLNCVSGPERGHSTTRRTRA